VTRTFPYLLLPHLWSSRNRARRRERGEDDQADAAEHHPAR